MLKMGSLTKSFLKSNSIFDAMSPVLSFGGILGITPFKIKINSSEPKTILSIPYSIINAVLLVFYYYSTISLLKLGEISFVLKNSQMFMYSEMFQIYSGSLIVALIHALKYYNRDSLAIYFEIAGQLHDFFPNLGNKRNYRRLKIKLYIASVLQFIFCICALGVTILAVQSLPDNEQLPALIGMFWPSFTTGMAQFTVSSFVYITFFNLRTLNEEFSELLPGPQLGTAISNIYYTEKKYSLHLQIRKQRIVFEKLELIWKAYESICKSTCKLDDYYSIIVLAIITLSFINCVFNTFFTFFVINYAHKSIYVYEIFFLRLVKCLMSGKNIFILAILCNVCEKEASFFKLPKHAYQTKI